MSRNLRFQIDGTSASRLRRAYKTPPPREGGAIRRRRPTSSPPRGPDPRGSTARCHDDDRETRTLFASGEDHKGLPRDSRQDRLICDPTASHCGSHISCDLRAGMDTVPIASEAPAASPGRTRLGASRAGMRGARDDPATRSQSIVEPPDRGGLNLEPGVGHTRLDAPAGDRGLADDQGLTVRSTDSPAFSMGPSGSRESWTLSTP